MKMGKISLFAPNLLICGHELALWKCFQTNVKVKAVDMLWSCSHRGKTVLYKTVTGLSKLAGKWRRRGQTEVHPGTDSERLAAYGTLFRLPSSAESPSSRWAKLSV